MKSKTIAIAFISAILFSSVSASADTVIYQYYQFNRLKQINRQDGTYTVYTYDEVGNRTAMVATSNAVAPIALFSALPTTGNAPLSVSFTDQSRPAPLRLASGTSATG